MRRKDKEITDPRKIEAVLKKRRLFTSVCLTVIALAILIP